MQDKWNELSQQGINIGVYFQMKEKKKLLLIGEGTYLERLQMELDAMGIQYTQDESDPKTDTVVVINSLHYMEIEKRIAEKSFVEVISLEELLIKVFNNRKVIK